MVGSEEGEEKRLSVDQKLATLNAIFPGCGANITNLARFGDGSGAMVMSVDPKGPGALAGVHQGDIIITWNGEPIRHLRSVLRALGADSVGRQITLGLRRAGESQQVSLTIGERPLT